MSGAIPPPPTLVCLYLTYRVCTELHIIVLFVSFAFFAIGATRKSVSDLSFVSSLLLRCVVSPAPLFASVIRFPNWRIPEQ